MTDLNALERRLGQEAREYQSPSKNALRKEQERITREAKARTLEGMQRVSRDPCRRCGVRSDIGCEHSG